MLVHSLMSALLSQPFPNRDGLCKGLEGSPFCFCWLPLMSPCWSFHTDSIFTAALDVKCKMLFKGSLKSPPCQFPNLITMEFVKVYELPSGVYVQERKVHA